MVEMEGHHKVQACLPSTSKVSQAFDEDATCSSETPATPLQVNETTTGSSEPTQAPLLAFDSSKLNIPYRTSLCDPKSFGIIGSSESYKITLSTESEIDSSHNIQKSNGVELVKSSDLVAGSSLTPLVGPLNDCSSNPEITGKNRIVKFHRSYEDRFPETFSVHIAHGEPVRFRDLVWAILTSSPKSDYPPHPDPLDMTGVLSLFTPSYSAKELSSENLTKDPKSPKTWQLGFIVRFLTQSLRTSFNGRAVLIRYTVSDDQESFKDFLKEGYIRERAAWNQISSMTNPRYRRGLRSPEFEKIAADFFGGRAVLFDHEYQKKTGETAWSPPHTKTFTITNDSFRLGDDIWNECNKKDSALCQFLKDCIKSNELESALVKRRKVIWLNNAQVDCSRIGPHSANSKLKAYLEDLNPAGERQSDMEEGDTRYPLTVASFFFVAEDSEAETKDEASTLAQSELMSDREGKIKTQIDGDETSKVPQPHTRTDNQNGDEDWAKADEDHKTKATNSFFKKKKRNGNKNKKKGKKKGKPADKKQPTQISSILDSESENESPLPEETKILANDTVSQPLNNFEDSSLDEMSGDWNVVQNKLPPRQGRSLNASAGTSGAMGSQAENQFRPPIAAFDQHAKQMPISKATTGQFHRQELPEPAASKSATFQELPAGPKISFAQSQTMDASLVAEKSAKTQTNIHENPEPSRTFKPEEYPALSSQDPASNMSPVAKVAGPQIVLQAMSSMQLDPVSISGTDVPTMDDVNNRNSHILLLREEAARFAMSQKIITRSATYSRTGVAIPNFYCVSEDEESDTEKTRFSSDGESFQTVSQQVNPREQHRNSHTAEGGHSSQNSVTSRPLVQFTALCTYCGERTTPSEEAREVFCSGCGPGCNIRYCSVSCLLVDSLDHASRCMNYPASSRAAYYNVPVKYFVYVLNPIMAHLNYVESPERFRQKAFSMYCSTGSFPTLFMAWMKKASVTYPSPQQADICECSKRTGDYVVFRSNATGPPTRNNPNAEVIFTIKLHPQDSQKEIFRRTLNACFLIWDSRLIEFLWRFIRHMILDPESFSIFKYMDPVDVVWAEFQHQFRREFNFDSSKQMCTDLIFNAAIEWNYISGIVAELEYHNPTLTQWLRS